MSVHKGPHQKSVYMLKRFSSTWINTSTIFFFLTLMITHMHVYTYDHQNSSLKFLWCTRTNKISKLFLFFRRHIRSICSPPHMHRWLIVVKNQNDTRETCLSLLLLLLLCMYVFFVFFWCRRWRNIKSSRKKKKFPTQTNKCLAARCSTHQPPFYIFRL